MSKWGEKGLFHSQFVIRNSQFLLAFLLLSWPALAQQAQSPYTLFAPTCPVVMPVTQCCYDTDAFTLSCGTGIGSITMAGMSSAGTPGMVPRFAAGGFGLENSLLASDPVNGNLGLRVTPSTYGLYIMDPNTLAGDGADILLEKYAASLSGPTLVMRHARGSLAAPEKVNANDIPGGYSAYAWARDAGNTVDAWVQVGGVRTAIEALDAEGRLAARTEIIGSSGVSASPVVKFRVTADGSVMMGSAVTGAPTASLDVFGQTVRVRTAKTPASATETCAAGTIVWDTGFVYVCVATSQWKRAALVTW